MKTKILIVSLLLGASTLLLGQSVTRSINEITSTTDSSATVTATSSVIVAANAGRGDCYVCNTGTTNAAYISRSGTAQSGKGIMLAPGGCAWIDALGLYRGTISAITASSTTTVSISEGTH